MDKILVLDFGGQYNQLIARRVRDQQVYAEIKSWQQITPEEIREEKYKGIIFTGGPNSVYDPSSPHYDPAVLDLGIPILGICYGDQLMAYMADGTVSSAETSSEYGKTNLHVSEHILFQDVPAESICWMIHTDYISEAPSGFMTIGLYEENAGVPNLYEEIPHTMSWKVTFPLRKVVAVISSAIGKPELSLRFGPLIESGDFATKSEREDIVNHALTSWCWRMAEKIQKFT